MDNRSIGSKAGRNEMENESIILPSFRCISHLRLCTVAKTKRKARETNANLLINTIACNELTTACRLS